ncbi:MAG: ammonium transporter [gamma proteobacterium symbiont of Stewartia floridana]|uniref:Ammonium transporter n=1 Tax=Candidatus Thiodiazotropha taylori TaxID=2792791 RepID=A0A9E4N815_9GAMM|nr:ammonium transporter [Candidatus Thiodiazotropha taylori]MCG7962336.1 ammonium transporter [Candidatus Thiodiazotropha endolucinida]RLW54049.1 MAG: ammonium transporter [gamma proteobacterium symbiont of Stewartia floridana]MCG7868858.1 ammonium transporter [Candidatus Thiodiazotropha taylori]MCG7895813.1 ammonium transporter [Candidatus Thiodiazotropha taylori]
MEAITHLSYALDTFYFLVSGALVMWMAAGFAMLEAGLVRAKNTAEILTKNVALFAIACIMYMLMGYNIMYPADGNGIFPALDLSFMFGGDNSVEDVLASNGDTYYSGMSDFFFQVVFVATAMSIVSGAVAERMKLWSFLLFAVVMTGVIYPLQGYWKWGGGFLDAAGFNDFAGSGVVHLCGASAALAGVILLGARKGKYSADGRVNAIPGANMPLATLGTFILWLGWFGFNGGSELKVSDIGEANAVAAVFVNTNAAAAGGVIAALLTARALFGKADLTMALNGALAGLVAITAEPLAPTPLWATIVGAIGGILVVFSIITMDKIKIDDPVGAISVHGVVGMWGLIAVPFSNTDAAFGAQFLGLGVIFAWTFIASFIVWLVLKVIMGIRVSEEEEYEGVDLGECGMEAYPEFTGNRGSGL